MPRNNLILILALILTAALNCGLRAAGTDAATSDSLDADYVQRYDKVFRRAAASPSLDDYASPARYDQLYMGAALDRSIKTCADNTSSALAWGLSYQMNSLNDMARATHDRKYLRAMRRCALEVIARRDDKLGRKLADGRTGPFWSCLLYTDKGRSVFSVHTGVAVYPILDFLRLARENKAYAAELGADDALILKAMQESLDYLTLWTPGPAADEGYYIARGEEPVIEGKVQPVNRLSAMGKARWLSWKLSGNTVHRDRAMALGRFLKNRLTPITDGDLYLWNYTLPVDRRPRPMTRAEFVEAYGSGEDISHGELFASFAALLAEDRQVFDRTDMSRLGRTVTRGFARLGGGALFNTIDGLDQPDSKPSPDIECITGRWLRLAPFAPEVYGRIWNHQRFYVAVPSPLDLAALIRYRPGADSPGGRN